VSPRSISHQSVLQRLTLGKVMVPEPIRPLALISTRSLPSRVAGSVFGERLVAEAEEGRVLRGVTTAFTIAGKAWDVHQRPRWVGTQGDVAAAPPAPLATLVQNMLLSESRLSSSDLDRTMASLSGR